MNDYSKSKLKEIEKKFGTGKNNESGRSVNLGKRDKCSVKVLQIMMKVIILHQ